VIRNVAKAAGGSSHMLLETREQRTAGIVVVSSDRGLAGAYNSNVIRLAEAAMIAHQKAGHEVRLYVIGKKAQGYFRFRGYEIERAFLGVTDTPGYGDARAIANLLMEAYVSEDVDSVEVFYTRFKSALTQEAGRFPLLPITPPEGSDDEEAEGSAPAYTYEPSPGEILDRILPRYVEAGIFGMLLESSASEHASRQRAMKAATDNATELTKVLTRVMNQARQAAITTEISEIVGGAEALAESMGPG
jgi:F-type H+-transporting ATPase subunit gamma